MKEFVELSDKSIINVHDIELLNVDKVAGEYRYKLYLHGKGMTLRLTETDYNIIRNEIIVKDNG